MNTCSPGTVECCSLAQDTMDRRSGTAEDTFVESDLDELEKMVSLAPGPDTTAVTDKPHDPQQKRIADAAGLYVRQAGKVKQAGAHTTGACGYNRPCAHQYVCKYQSCMVQNGRSIPHASYYDRQ